jgi:hypothetical protein
MVMKASRSGPCALREREAGDGGDDCRHCAQRIAFVPANQRLKVSSRPDSESRRQVSHDSRAAVAAAIGNQNAMAIDQRGCLTRMGISRIPSHHAETTVALRAFW